MPTFLSVVDAAQGYRHGPTTPVWKTGTGTPQGVVAAPVGSLYSRLDGGTDTAVYRKEAGTDANGWVAVTNSGTGGGLVTSVDGRTGVVTLGDKYVDVTGDTMTGPLVTAPQFNSATDVTAITASAWNSDAGIVWGVAGTVTVDSGGTTPQAGVLSASISQKNAAGTILSGYGLHVRSPWNGESPMGAITHLYGVRIEGQKTTGVTNGYGIYQAGAPDLNYFAGNLGLGEATPMARLHFMPATNAVGGISFGADTNLYRSAADTLRTDDSLVVGVRVDATSGFRHGSSTAPSWTTGAGTPEGVVTAAIGSLFSRTDGSTGTAVYRKEAGVGNTGWVAVSTASGVASVDGRTGVVTLSDLYVDVAGDNMTGNLGLGAPAPTAKLQFGADTTATGGILFGTDTTLYRSGPDVLQTDDSFKSAGRIEAALSTTAGGFRQGPTGPMWVSGSGTPEGVVIAPIGSIYSRTNGAANTALYRKETGTGFSGWVAVGSAGVSSVDGRNGAVVLSDLYVDVTGDTMTGELHAPVVSVGVASATAGQIRLSNDDSIQARNAANTADLMVITTQTNNYIQVGASGQLGVAIGSGTGRSLWVSANSNPTTAAGGITFGTSADTNLYRSAADTLKTDDSLVVGVRVDATSGFRHGSALLPSWTSGAGSPEGVITAPVGSIYSRTDGGADTALYRKEAGIAATGWVATSSAGAVTSVDGRTGVVTLADKYVDVTGDTMTGALTVNTNTYVDGYLTVGAAYDPNLRLQVRNTTAHTTSLTGLGGRISTVWSGSGALSNVYLRGLDAIAQASLAAGGTYTNALDTAVVALFGISQMDGDGAYGTWANGVAGRVTRNGAGNLTNAVALNANYPSVAGGGSITNAYGLYVGAQKAVGVTNGYGIYQSGSSDQNYFAGSVVAAELAEKKAVFTPTTVGWYRIATGGGNTGGMMRITAGYDNKFTDIEIQFNISGYGQPGAIQQTRHATYNSGTVSDVRASTDGGGNNYLDIYVSSATTPGPVTIYGYGPRMMNLVAAPVVGAVAGSTLVGILTLGHGFRTTDLVAASSLVLGATPASYGGIRLTNGMRINWRNAGNTADVGQIMAQSDDNLWVNPEAGRNGYLSSGGAAVVGWNSAGMALLTPLNCNKYEAQNLVTHKLAAAPASPVEGQRYYDTTLKLERYWDGTKWSDQTDVWVGPGAPTGTPSVGDEWYDTDEPSSLVFPLSVANGGTGGTSPAMARSALSVPYVGNSTTTAGGPTTGTYVRGDTWLDSSNVLWVCTIAGSPGTWVSTSSGEELAYAQITVRASVTATTVAGAQLIIDSGARVYDGSPILITFYASNIQTPSTAGSMLHLNLWDGSSDLGYIGNLNAVAAGVQFAQCMVTRRLTPTGGTHTYRLMASIAPSGTGAIEAGAGGAATSPPAYLRVTRA